MPSIDSKSLELGFRLKVIQTKTVHSYLGSDGFLTIEQRDKNRS